VLEDRGSGEWEAANSSVTDAAIEQARRYARMQYLRGRIDGLEADAQEQDNTADDLEQRGKSGAITKIIGAIGTGPAVKLRLQAEKDRAEAQSMRDELARLENQDRLNAGIPAP
jgi:hypothetical protein